MTRARLAALLVGIVVLDVAWVVSGAVTDGYDPVEKSISQLQRAGTSTTGAMTAAFVVFAVGALAAAGLLPSRPLRVVVAVIGVAVLGAAASPLPELRGGLQDSVHQLSAIVGYASLSLLPWLGARATAGRARAASYVLGVVTTTCLVLTVPLHEVSGAVQRVGFLAGHLWLVGWAVSRWRRQT